MDCESDESDRWEDFFGKPKCRSISQIPKKKQFFFCKSTACLKQKKKWTQNQKYERSLARTCTRADPFVEARVCVCVCARARMCMCFVIYVVFIIQNDARNTKNCTDREQKKENATAKVLN